LSNRTLDKRHLAKPRLTLSAADEAEWFRAVSGVKAHERGNPKQRSGAVEP